MSADATINIDVMLSNLPKFKTDVSFIDEILSKLGANTGKQMDESFAIEAKSVQEHADATKKKIDDTLGKTTKVKLTADNTDVKEKSGEAKDQVSKIPDKKSTTFTADAVQAKTETRELGETAEKTESKFVSLKDKLTIGAVAGATSQAVQVITGSFTDLIGEGLAASDSMDKFRSTMKLGSFGDEEIDKAAKAVKKYADDTVYDLSDVSNTTAQLAANGIKNYTELTQAAGNLNAQAGGNADTFKSVAMVMTQTAGAGKLTTENWNQLADAIPGASGVLQEAMKKNGAFTGNFREAMEKGEISADEFNTAITELGMNDGAVKAAKSTSTFEGAVGNLRANVVSGIMDIINHLGKDNLTGMVNKASDAVVGVFQHIADVFLYFQKHEDTITNISNNVKKIVGSLFSGAWEEGKDLLFDVGKMLGLVDENAQSVKDPLELINEIIGKIAKHKDEIELFGKALVVMFAVKKGYEFITMLKEAKKTLMEMTAIETITDFLGGGGFSFGKKASTKNIGNVGAEIAETILPKGGKGVATIADNALESASKLGGLAKLSKGVSKVLPFAGVLASATELLGKGSASSKLGAFGGSLGGSAAGAAIGTAILPGIGTAIGAGLGGLGGTELGKKLGKHIGKGFKSYAPNLTNFLGDIGHDITKKFSKNVGSNAKELSKTYTKEMEKLNKIAVKTPKGDKELKKQKAQTTEIFKDMSGSIKKYYKKKEKSSKSDYDYFVKNGLMTQKEADKALAKQKKNDNEQKWNHQKALKSMQVYSGEHYANVEKIEKGGTKKLQDIAKEHGKDSKEYKKELNKELEEEQEKYAKNMSKAETKLNEQISTETKIASGKQLDILQSLKEHKGKLSHEEMKNAILNSKEQRDTIIKDAKKTADDSISAADKKYKETVEKADKERYENGTMSKKQYDEVVKQAKKERDDTVTAATDKRDKSIKKAQETHKEVVDQATQQAGEHKGAVDGETGEVVGSWDEMKTNMGSIVEGVAHSIGHLIHALNKDWGNDLINFKFGAHAKGSSGLTEDEIALVGEEGFELAHHPSKGIFPVGVSGPEIRPLQAGTSILPHHMSKEFLAMTKGLPAHKDGVWGTITNMFDWVKDKAKDVWSFVSDGAGKAYDTIADKLGVSDFLDNLGDSAEYKVAAGGISSIKDKIIEYAQSFFDKFNEENGGGSFDGAMADNVYKYLVDIANQAVRKFGMSGITSGYRPGDPYWHGKHQAIDIAYPSSMNGSSKYFDPANWVFENFADKVGYVITQGKVRDRTGQSGQPATGSWEPWPDNDHYDHLHITGKLGSGDIYKAGEGGGKGSPTGSGVARWTSQLKEALRMNGLPTTASYVNAWLRQIETESGGNERAVQPGIDPDGDGSGPAMGLIQAKKGTFLANVFSGHGNIFNGFDSMLAGIRYALKRYGPDMLAVIGHGHGYADGGEINGPELAWIGEDPAYPKEFMINPAKPSADDLIIKAIRSREQFRPASANNVSSNSSGFLTSEISESSLQKLSQAFNNRPVEVISHLDGKKVSKSVDEYTGSSLARKLYMRGKNFNG
ncbi:tape measure protein [Enterococcus faecium]|uniref:tape measure protein n=1 Tax=Enterococcus faecium TaxID=1352 RepID=UPI002073B3EA|nr:tape measure protein [Enterococcus faecium]MCM6871254.1 tape measure protein [Enterococcus faecium]MCM6876855.1 tape measure protein [Enterococcus faecium]MCM6887868.1 tape measure protein [Enterococcus faecium]MCM6890304.1 tape measure protein [Enterococcus faecium]MCM6910908.1 tape measure protein [Enterococcus faecium]